MTRRLRARLSRLVLLSYPPSFRERYGIELSALVDDTGVSARTLVDLAHGSVRAWVWPTYIGDRAAQRSARLRASVGTIWAAGTAAALVVPGMNRLLFDPLPQHSDPTAQRLAQASQIPLLIAAVLLIGAGAIAGLAGLRSVRPSERSQVVRPLAPAALLGGIEALGLIAVWALRRGHPSVWPHPSIAFVAVGVAWVLGFGLFVIAAAVGPPLALRRTCPAVGPLQTATIVATVAVGGLTVAVGMCVAAASLQGLTPAAVLASLYGIASLCSAAVAARRALPV